MTNEDLQNSALGISQEYLRRARILAAAEISKRSLYRIPIYFLLFLAIVWVTPLLHRFPKPVLFFGGLIFLLSVGRLSLALNWEKLSNGPGLLKNLQWKNVMIIGIYLTAMLWGLFCSLTIQYFELGWTSFFVMLATVGIAAGEISVLSPNFPALSSFMGLMLGPTALASFLLVKGLSGFAIGVFFSGYMAFLIVQGRRQSIEYWEKLRENSQFRAIIDSVPGTLSWINSEMEYQGVNWRMAELWNSDPSAFVGKKMGFMDGSTPILEFVRSVFQSDVNSMSTEVQLTIRGQLRNYFVFVSKFNLGSEAIILGLDITEIRESEKTVVNERALRFYSAKLSNLGQVAHIVYAAIKENIEEIRMLLDQGSADVARQKTQTVNSTLDLVQTISTGSSAGKPVIDFLAFIQSVAALFSGYSRVRGVTLTTDVSPEVTGKKSPITEGSLAMALVSLLSNAFDAVSEVEKKEVILKCELDRSKKKVEISVVDSGKGIPAEVRPRLFEPLFTTKAEHEATGTGLSVSKEIMESFGGTLALDSESARTRFVISVPVSG